MSETCACKEFLEKPITVAGHAPMGNQRDKILASCDQLARSEAKWMGVYRCRSCGTLWAEACYDSGQVMFDYVFPAPPTDDPVRWLNEQAVELPKY